MQAQACSAHPYVSRRIPHSSLLAFSQLEAAWAITSICSIDVAAGQELASCWSVVDQGALPGLIRLLDSDAAPEDLLRQVRKQGGANKGAQMVRQIRLEGPWRVREGKKPAP